MIFVEIFILMFYEERQSLQGAAFKRHKKPQNFVMSLNMLFAGKRV